MPTFEFTSPDGKVYEVGGPEGATQEQAFQILQTRLGQTPSRPTPQATPTPEQSMQAELGERNLGEQFLGGVGATAIESWYGLKDLFGQLTEQERKELEFLKGIRGGAATAGRIGGDIALLAAPGGAGAAAVRTGARALPRAVARAAATRPRLARAAGTAVGEAGGIAAAEAIRTPGTARERAEVGTGGALATLAGHGVGQAAARALGGLPRSPAAQQLLDEGVPLTPGQAAPDTFIGRAVRNTESAMRGVPFMGGGATRLQDQALQQMNRRLLQGTIPDVPGAVGVTIRSPGNAGFRQAQETFSKLYDDFWETALERAGPEGAQRMARVASNIVNTRAGMELSDEAAQRVGRYVSSRVAPILKNPSSPKLQKLNQDLRDYALKARDKGDFVEAEVVEEAMEMIQRSFGAELGEQLKRINTGYAQLSVLQEAANYAEAARRGGVFTPNELSNAVRKVGTPRRVSAGTALMQPQANVAQETLGELAGARPSGLTRIGRGVTGAALTTGAMASGNVPLLVGAGAAGRSVVTEPMRRALTGDPRLAQAIATAMGRASAAYGSQ